MSESRETRLVVGVVFAPYLDSMSKNMPAIGCLKLRPNLRRRYSCAERDVLLGLHPLGATSAFLFVPYSFSVVSVLSVQSMPYYRLLNASARSARISRRSSIVTKSTSENSHNA